MKGFGSTMAISGPEFQKLKPLLEFAFSMKIVRKKKPKKKTNKFISARAKSRERELGKMILLYFLKVNRCSKMLFVIHFKEMMRNLTYILIKVHFG